MSLQGLLVRTVDVVRNGTTVTSGLPAWFGDTRVRESIDQTRDPMASAGVMTLEPGQDVQAGDRLLLDGTVLYEVIGDPVNAWTPRGPHHLEAYVRKDQARDVCAITRITGARAVYNSGTDSYDDPTTTPVYTGACQVARTQTVPSVSEVVAGEAQSAKRRWVVTLPGPAPAVLPLDIFTLTSSADPALLAASPMIVVELEAFTDASGVRFVVETPTGADPTDG